MIYKLTLWNTKGEIERELFFSSFKKAHYKYTKYENKILDWKGLKLETDHKTFLEAYFPNGIIIQITRHLLNI